MLVKSGADVNLVRFNGETPLMIAVMKEMKMKG